MNILSLPLATDKQTSEPVVSNTPKTEHSDATPINKYLREDDYEDMSDIFDEWEFK